MEPYELIPELRDAAEVERPGTMCHLLSEAADQIEALDERVSIMAASFQGLEQHARRLQRADRAAYLLLMAAVIVIIVLLGQR